MTNELYKIVDLKTGESIIDRLTLKEATRMLAAPKAFPYALASIEKM